VYVRACVCELHSLIARVCVFAYAGKLVAVIEKKQIECMRHVHLAHVCMCAYAGELVAVNEMDRSTARTHACSVRSLVACVRVCTCVRRRAGGHQRDGRAHACLSH